MSTVKDFKHMMLKLILHNPPFRGLMQKTPASGLNLVVAAIVLWNTVYLERAIQSLRDSGKIVDDKLLIHLSPFGWEHINLNGNYVWQQNKEVEQGNFRPLRTPNNT